MRHPNGYGSVRKLSGNRRRPYQVLITTGWDEERQIQKPLGYYERREEALMALAAYNRTPYSLDMDITFQELYESLDFTRRSESSKGGMRTAYGRCSSLYEMKMKDIRKNHLQKIADGLVVYSVATQREVKVLWNLMFRKALEDDTIQKDYSQFVKFESDAKPRERRPFDAEQVKTFSGDLKVLCFTGMRIQEFIDWLNQPVDVKRQDAESGFIYVRKCKTPAAKRYIPIHKEIKGIVDNMAAMPNVNMDYYVSQKAFLREMNELGIEGHTLHDTRRTFFTYAAKAEMDELSIKRIGGHKTQDITKDVYTYKFKPWLAAEMEKLVIF